MYGPGSHGVFAPKVDFMSMSLLMLGIGSFLFHATLRQALEFVDELSMLGLTWSMLQAVLTAQQSTATARLISIALAAFHIPFLAFYVWSAQIIYQVVAFLGTIALIGFRTHYLLYQPGMSKEKSRDWTVRALRAVFISVFGYILWNIDIKFCQELRDIRGRVGLPWAWLFEHHGWWHILTALGAARFMDVVREVRKGTDMRKRA
jgi:dihydroceramidase